MTTDPAPAYDAVVLTGGTGERLGGLDKALLVHGGRTLLERALDACADARATVVVGPARDTSRPVAWTREDPPGGGPGAAMLAGVDALPDPAPAWLLVLAVDMALVSPATVRRLRAAAAGDGAVLLDPDGRRQLCAVLRRRAVLEARPGGTADGLPVHRLLARLALAEVSARADEALDVDTPGDLADLDRHDHQDESPGTA